MVDGYSPPLPSLGTFWFDVGHLGPILKEVGSWGPSAGRRHPVWPYGHGGQPSGLALLVVSALGGARLPFHSAPLPSAPLGRLSGPIWDVPGIGPSATGRTNPVIGPGPVSGISLAPPGYRLPAGGCWLVPCADRPSPGLKVPRGQAHAQGPAQDECRLVREGPHLPSSHGSQGRLTPPPSD